MTRPLDVLVLENRRNGARIAAEELEAAGYRVHRCHEPADPSFPCRGVVNPSDCPLEGPIDVALVVRQHIHPYPSTLEDGVACAIRAGVPVVEDGSSILDPFEPWITARVEHDPLTVTCHQAVDMAFQPIANDVLRRCRPLLDAAGIDSSDVTCRLEMSWPKLQVHLEVPGPVSAGIREALAVRALDAVRSDRRKFEKINVQVHEAGG